MIKPYHRVGPIGQSDTIYIEIGANFHNKYKYYHNLELDLTTGDYALINWEVGQDSEANLAPNFESNYFIFDYDSEEPTSKGMVQEIYAILNGSNTLAYYLSESIMLD